MSGYKKSIETRMKMSEAMKKYYASHPEEIEKKKLLIGSKNPNWKDNLVKNSGLHAWIRKNKPKLDYCEHCLKPKRFDELEVANVSRKYLRDINDYLWLCISCHKKFDNIIYNIVKKHDWI